MRRIVFVKSVHGRRPNFAIRTTAESGPDGVVFHKTPRTTAARAHLLGMSNCYAGYAKRGLAHLFCAPQTDSSGRLTFPKVRGVALEEELAHAALTGNWQTAEKLLTHYEKLIDELAQTDVVEHVEVRQLFGNSLKPFSSKRNLCPGLIDLGFDNIIITERGPVVIDYEWSLPGSLPSEYVFFRALMLFAQRYNHLFRLNADRIEVIGLGDTLALPRWFLEKYPQLWGTIAQCHKVEEECFRPYANQDISLGPCLDDAIPSPVSRPIFALDTLAEKITLLAEATRLENTLRTKGQRLAVQNRQLKKELVAALGARDRLANSVRYRAGTVIAWPYSLIRRLTRRR